jgi:hypothetical protein
LGAEAKFGFGLRGRLGLGLGFWFWLRLWLWLRFRFGFGFRLWLWLWLWLRLRLGLRLGLWLRLRLRLGLRLRLWLRLGFRFGLNGSWLSDFGLDALAGPLEKAIAVRAEEHVLVVDRAAFQAADNQLSPRSELVPSADGNARVAVLPVSQPVTRITGRHTRLS